MSCYYALVKYTNTFCVFFHGQTEPRNDGQGEPYETDQMKGCKLVSTEVVESPYTCELVFTVKNADGDEVDYSGCLSAGMYTVTVEAQVDGEPVGAWTEEVEVKKGETTAFDSGKLTLHEMDDVVINCDYCENFKQIPLTPAVSVEP